MPTMNSPCVPCGACTGSSFVSECESLPLLITQVGYDTPGADSKEEYIEIYNPGGSAVSLSGCYDDASVTPFTCIVHQIAQ